MFLSPWCYQMAVCECRAVRADALQALAVKFSLCVRLRSDLTDKQKTFVSQNKHRHHQVEELCLLVSFFLLCGLVITFS